MKWLATILVVLAALVGCAASAVVEPKRVSIGGVYTVDPQIRWSRFHLENTEAWTVDGPPLQALYFFNGIKGGKPLAPAAAGRAREEKWPRFRPEMTPHESMEFVVDSLVRLGLAQLQARDLRPEQFGPWPGFRFDLQFQYRDGLDGQGLVLGAVVAERLHLIMYLGAREHYYPKHVQDVEKILQSIQAK